jgi:hypothetical protein
VVVRRNAAATRSATAAVGRHPGRVLGRIPLADLGVVQAFPRAAVALAQVLVEDHVKAGQAGQGRRGARGAAQAGGDDHVRAQPGEQPRGALGLR